MEYRRTALPRLIIPAAGSFALALGLALILAPTSAAASTCYNPWSGAASTTSGPVCGAISISGFHEGDVLTPGGDLTPKAGNSVSLSAGGGGTGITGLASVSGTFGTGHIFANSQIDAPRPDTSQVSSRGYFSFTDQVTVGPNDVQAQFTSSVDGSFFGAGSGKAVLNVQDLANNGYVVNDLQALVNETFPSQTKTALVTLTAGHQYTFSWAMTALADATVDFFNNRPNVLADLSGTGHLYIDMVSPNGSLSFASGHDYASTAAVTPLPPAGGMMMLALSGLGVVARRRRKIQTS